MGELRRLVCLLEERLVQHNNSRVEVQGMLDAICAATVEEATLLEEKVHKEIRGDFDETEERVLSLIEKIKNNTEEDGTDDLIGQTQRELAHGRRYAIEHIDSAESFADSYKLVVATALVPPPKRAKLGIVDQLKEHLNAIYESMVCAQNGIAEICSGRKDDAEELRVRINKKLESLFTAEDSRLQSLINLVKKNPGDEAMLNAKTALLINRRYTLCKLTKKLSLDSYNLAVTEDASLECLALEEKKPSNLSVLFTGNGLVSLSFSVFSDDEAMALKQLSEASKLNPAFRAFIEVWEEGKNEGTARTLTKDFTVKDPKEIRFSDSFTEDTGYCLKLKIGHRDQYTRWSEGVAFTTPGFRSCCVWKKCPEYPGGKRYSVEDEKNPRVATMTGCTWCTIVGSTPLPSGRATSWSIKVLRTKRNGGYCIFIGVAPSGISQSADNHNRCGWYFHCYDSALYSGPPHKYRSKAYGPRKEKYGQYVHTGGTVGVVMDTAKGELSFILNNVNYGVAYEGIPLDKPLAPCVLLNNDKGDSVELDTSEAKENVVDSSLPVPSNITAKSETWDTITLTLDCILKPTFYQIEVDGRKSWDTTTGSTFTKTGLLADTEHCFRARTVRKGSVSEWSDVVKGRTLKESFKASGWEECPAGVAEDRKYTVNEKNPRIATKASEEKCCTLVWNGSLPTRGTTSWGVKILKSKRNDGEGIYVGVAPCYIDQNSDNNNKCGWYFDCWTSSLWSGPPHNYSGKWCGPRKGVGEYVHTGDCVGVTMETTSRNLSFALNNVTLGIAYEEVPLDKPLFPCVILYYDEDSVELKSNGY